MNLKSLYEFDIDKIKLEVEKDYKCNFKSEGYRLEKKDDFYYLLGWQYTKLNYINNKINTFMFIKAKIDKDYKIVDIELDKNFLGSQKGCNGVFLNDNLKNRFLNEKLDSRNLKIKDYKNALCRHIYELLYGMSDFLLYSINNKLDNNFYYEKSIINIGLFKIIINTETNLNNIAHNFITSINNINKLKFDKNYNIIGSNINVSSLIDNNLIIYDNIISKSNTEFYQKYLKLIYKKWNKENEIYNIKNLYSFTILFPTSLYSFIVQLMTVYMKIYDKKALYKCLSNFQIVNNEAVCIGFRKD